MLLRTVTRALGRRQKQGWGPARRKGNSDWFYIDQPTPGLRVEGCEIHELGFAMTLGLAL